jgi:hypothetical protein
MQSREELDWKVHYKLEKFHEDIGPFKADGTEAEFYETYAPYEVIEGDGNLLVNAGIALLEDLLIGAGGTVFSNANAYIGVGDSSTAASASQTDLQAATNKFRDAMEATFPSRAAQTLTFKSAFATGEANFAWEEWAIFNAAAAGTMLNRKVQSFGTKVSGTWTLTVTIVIS